MEYNSTIDWLRSQLVATESLLSTIGDDLLMRISLENRIEDLKEKIETASQLPDSARLDVWFSGRGVYGSQGIAFSFMKDTMQSIVGMIQSITRDKVRRLKEQHKKVNMPHGQFYITALTHGSFGYELTYKDNEGQLFDDPAIIESIHSTMGVIEEATENGLNVDAFIQMQPIRLISNLKELFTTLNKQESTLRMECGNKALSIDTHHVSTGYGNICLSDITEKEEEIEAVFKGAFIETGKFEYTDVEGYVHHGNISEDLSTDEIVDFNKTYSQRKCKLHIIRRIVSYTSGQKKENVELIGIMEI